MLASLTFCSKEPTGKIAHIMSMRLRAQFADVELALDEEPTVLGRSRQLHIPSTAVSRHACSCFREGRAQARVVAHKTIYVKLQQSSSVSAVSKDETCKVQHSGSLGDFQITICSEPRQL